MRLLIFLVFFGVTSAKCSLQEYFRIYNNDKDVRGFNSSWTDLDTRPLPSWFDKAKIGIFLHWGLYSVPSYAQKKLWYIWKGGNKQVKDFRKANYPPGFSYQELAPMFKAELFEPEEWADLFVKSGAKYVIMTSKHHDGFAMFPSKRSFSWNSVELGPKRDLIGDLATAVKDKSLKFGFLYSLYEWYNPIYNEDKNNGFKTRTYPETKVWPEMRQLVKDYKPSVIWVTGDWQAPNNYWKASEFLSWLYNDSPVKNEVVVNDQWGKNMAGKHGDFYTKNYKNNPGEHKWELAIKLDKQCWGYRRNMLLKDVMTIEEILYHVVSTISRGGNILINIGPTKEGTIDLIFQERLLSLGSWLSINGEAIYDSSPWNTQQDTLNGDVWYTCVRERNITHFTANPNKNDNINKIYAIVLKWPSDGILKLKDMSSLLKNNIYSIEVLGNERQLLPWQVVYDEVKITLPLKSSLKSELAWTLRFTLNLAAGRSGFLDT